MPGDLTGPPSIHPGIPDLVDKIRGCSKEMRKRMLVILTRPSGVAQAPIIQPFSQSIVDRFKSRLRHDDLSSTQTRLSLGTYILGALPVELQAMVLDHMNISTLLRLSWTCRLARIIVHRHPDFRVVTTYANDAFLAVITTRIHRYRTLGDIARLLRTPKCHNTACRAFAELVYLPDMTRICLDCLKERARSMLSDRPKTNNHDILVNAVPEYFSFNQECVPMVILRRSWRIGSRSEQVYMRIVDTRAEALVPESRIPQQHRGHHLVLRHYTNPAWSLFEVFDMQRTVPRTPARMNLTSFLTTSFWLTSMPASAGAPDGVHLAASIAVPYLVPRGGGEVVERGVRCLCRGQLGGVMLPNDFLDEHLPKCPEACRILASMLKSRQKIPGLGEQEKDECRQLLKVVMPLV
ncbi:hypothetical protein V8F20_003436 [Naviculisporaceae sp. PSN 640]